MANYAIGDRLIQLQLIQKFFSERTTADATSIKDAMIVLGDRVAGEQQVKNCVTRLHEKGKLSRIREGREYKYFGGRGATHIKVKSETEEELMEDIEKLLAETTMPSAPTPSDKPRIHVTNKQVCIETGKYHITIDLLD